MAEHLVSKAPCKKRKIEAQSPDQGRLCRLLPVSLLSPTKLLLQMPPKTNTSLPVWECVNAAQAEVQWTVAPYGITIQITPITTQKAQSHEQPTTQAPSLSETQLSTIPVPASLPVASTLPTPGTTCGVSLDQNTTGAWSPLDPHTFNPQPVFSNQTQTLMTPKPQTATQSHPKAIQLAPPSCQRLAHPNAWSSDVVIDLPSMFYQIDVMSCYTQSSGDVYICDRFLTGHCRSKLSCKQHHTPFPFHWQLRCRGTHQWVDVSLSAQVTLEKMYCDTGRDTAKLQDEWVEGRRDVFHLQFDTMTVRNSVKYDKARRLSNSTSAVRVPCMATLWKVYWWNDYVWERYKKEVSSLLLEKMEARKRSCRFHIGEQEYEVDFSSMTQRNLTTGFRRRVRRRPTFRSLFTLSAHLKINFKFRLAKEDLKVYLQYAYSDCKLVTVALRQPPHACGQAFQNLTVDPLQEFSSWYPPVWTLSPDPGSDQGFNLVEVPPKAKAYQSIYCLFHSTVSETKTEIISIQQIQNVFQWDKYRRQKEHMESHSAGRSRSLERHLFHGTTADSAWEICLNNFDPRVSGKNGRMYGRGSYFAHHASYSDTFTLESGGEKCQHMFLAKVLVGRMSVGKPSFCRPPRLIPQMPGLERYDTCVNRLYNPTTFVVFDSCQCYPYYLIKYRPTSSIVSIV